MSQSADCVALVLRDAARLVGRVRLVPTDSGMVPAVAHADLWRAVPGLLRRLVRLADTGRLDLSECGGNAEAMLETAALIEAFPCPGLPAGVE